MKLDQIIAEADQIIEKRASAPAKEQPVSNDGEVSHLANFLENFEGEKTAQVREEAPFQLTFVEKMASAIAIVEAVNNFEQFQKLAQFQEHALKNGYTQEQVDEFLEKKALKVPTSVAIPALAAVAAGVGGHLHGKKKGYDKAIKDVHTAFEQANAGQ